jgi:subfamily B ATP-binding cassette protein MsbA
METRPKTGNRRPVRDFLRLWTHLREHAGWLALAAIAMLIFAVTTSAYAYLVGPVLRFIFMPDQGAPPAVGLTPALWDWLVAHRDVYPLVLAGLILGLALVRGLAQFCQNLFMGVVGQRVQLAIRDSVFDKLMRMSPYRLVHMEKGDLSSRFVSDVVVLEYAITHGLSAVLGDTVQIVALLSLALYLDPVLGLVSLVILPFSSLLIVHLGRRIRSSQMEAMSSLGKISSSLVEGARGLSVLQAYGAESVALDRFRTRNAGYYARVMRAVVLGSLSSPLMELIAAGALAATLWYARVRIGGGTLEPEQFVSFFAAIFLLYRPIKSIGGLNALMNRGLAAAHRVFGFLDTQEDEIPGGDAQAPAIEQGIRLESVSFAYGGEQVLDAIDLAIPAGRTTALVGASGAGKTTIAALLCRLLVPTGGRILWDGEDVSTFSVASLRAQVALVPQDPFLFHDTIRANLELGAPDADEKRMRRALGLVDAEGFVERLPGSLDETVGEEGSTLSGGERQRICLARAALRDAPVLVLDEAASSLDAASEEAARRGLDQLSAGRTVLVIGHRLSSVKKADSIAVLDAGRIVEQGTYEELARPGTRFHALFEAQLTGERPSRS